MKSHRPKSGILLCVSLFFILNSIMLFPQNKPFAVKGGTFITVTQGIIESGVLIIQNGKILAIGKNIPIPKNVYIIDASKCTVIPGLIDAFSNLGTTEKESFSQDFDEATSPLTPHLRIIDGINPENKFISLARKCGVTSILCAPGEGNLLSGQSALLHLYGSTIEEMIIKFPVGIHGSLGELPKMRYGQKGLYPMTRMGEIALLRQTLIETQEYLSTILDYERKLQSHYEKEKKGQAKPAEKPQAPAANFKLQSLIPVIKGTLPLIVRANRIDDILSALRLAKEFHLKIILNHGAEAYRIADKLASQDIPVLIGPYTENYLSFETAKAVPENAFLLHKAGVKIAFQTGSYKHFSNLLNQAKMAVSQGLPMEEAVKALTLSPAQIFGVEDRIGSLEKGKIADIVIFEGGPFSSPSRVKMVIIKGEIVENFFTKDDPEKSRNEGEKND